MRTVWAPLPFTPGHSTRQLLMEGGGGERGRHIECRSSGFGDKKAIATLGIESGKDWHCQPQHSRHPPPQSVGSG